MSTDKRKVLKPLKEMETIWHPDSTLVFKSKTEKVVIGRWINGEFVPLDEEAVELCTQWSFKYDQELYDELMAEGGEEVEGDEGVEGDEELEGGEDEETGEEEQSSEVEEPTENAVEEKVEIEEKPRESQLSPKELDNLTLTFTNNLNNYL